MECWNPNDDDLIEQYNREDRRAEAWQLHVAQQVEMQLAAMELEQGARPGESAFARDRRLTIVAMRVEFCHDRARAALREYRRLGGVMPEGVR